MIISKIILTVQNSTSLNGYIAGFTNSSLAVSHNPICDYLINNYPNTAYTTSNIDPNFNNVTTVTNYYCPDNNYACGMSYNG